MAMTSAALQWSPVMPLGQAAAQAPARSGVYRLLRGSTVLSRGESEDLRRRLLQHAACARRMRTNVTAQWALTAPGRRKAVERAMPRGVGDRRELELALAELGGGREASFARLAALLSSLGLRMTRAELRRLLAGLPVSLARHPIREVGEALIRADALHLRRGAEGPALLGEMTTSSAGSCPGCKGLCFRVSDRSCLCVGLLSVSYCYVDPLK
jgi:hypothetical protein